MSTVSKTNQQTGALMDERPADEPAKCSICGKPLAKGNGFRLCPACMFDFPDEDGEDLTANQTLEYDLEHSSTMQSSGGEPPDENSGEGSRPSGAGPPRPRVKTTVVDRGLPQFDGSPPGEPPKTARSGQMRFGRWILAIVYVILAAGAVWRLFWVEQTTREPVDLSYMLQSGEFSVAYALQGCEPPYPDPTQLSWYTVGTLPAVTQSGDGTIEVSLNDRIAALVDGRPLVKVNGLAVEDPSIDQILPANPNDRVRWLSFGSEENRAEIAFLRIMMPTYWAKLVAGLSIGALGVLAYWLRPGRKSTVGFLIACLCVALLWYARAVPFHLRLGIENLIYYLLQSYIVVPYIVFMVTFTPLRRLVTKPLYAAIAVAIPPTIILVTNGILDPASMIHGYLTQPMYLAWIAYSGLLILVTAPAGLWCRALGVELTPTDKARGRLVGIAVLVSFLPILAFLPLNLYAGSTRVFRLVPELAVVAFPALILYAIVRHNLLRMSELLRDGLVYGLLSIGLLGLYAAVAASATALFANLPQGYLQSLAMGGTVLVAIPSHTIMRRVIRRRLEIPPEEYDDLLHRLDEVAKAAPSPDGYCRDVVRFLERVTKSDRVSILVREPGDVDWKISDSLIGPGLTPVSPSCTPLIHELEATNSEIFVDDFLDDLNAPRYQETPLQGLQTLHANALLPLSARNQLVGALALGARVDDRNHSGRELKLYRRLGDHIAVTLVHMFDRLRAASGNRIVDIYPDCPKRIGNYIIDSVLGEGGMSYVYLGHNSLGYAAIKVCNRFVQSDRKLLERFHREGLTLSKLKHANIVPVFDVGWEGPEPYIAMEYFQRGSLDDTITTEGPCAEAIGLRYLLDAVRGLNAALKAGIIHRDIKPTNMFLTLDNHVKIGDFGLARLADQSTLTREGEIFGTPHFMSPEILRGQPTDWTADQYALGISLFFILTGQLPFEGDSMESLHYQHANATIPDVRSIRPELSTACSNLIAKMAAKNKEDRFESYAQIEHEVRLVGKRGE
jgi:predicted Ser/Thr protein kinase